jgi:hypothetical protein
MTTYQEFDAWLIQQANSLPIPRNDRAAQAQTANISKAGQNAATNATTTAGGYGSSAAGIGGTLIPTLTKEATNPQGFNPTDVNNMTVASEQSAGGANSGITGQAALQTARSRNAGGFSGALDAAARIKGQQLSSASLGIQDQNAQLKQSQQQEGIKGLSNMYGTDVSAQLKGMGLTPEDLNASTNAENSNVNAGQHGWLQQGEGVLDTMANVAKG